MPGRDQEAGGGLPPQAYRDERPAASMQPAHEWARTHEPGWTYTAVRIVMSPPALLLYRCRARGLGNVPANGSMILAPNHFSNFDHFFVGVRLRRRIRFMTKSQFFAANPALDYLFRVSGHFPVRRGHDDEEAFTTAHSILDRNGCVGIYAEGGRSRSGGLGEPRRGVGRLALESGAPVVPTAIHGSQGTREWRRGRFPRVTVSYGEPLSFPREPEPSRERQQEAAEEIFARVRGLYEELASGR
jgi:1-acyl-sn-glycerol-3-phosphate acyltransferase